MNWTGLKLAGIALFFAFHSEAGFNNLNAVSRSLATQTDLFVASALNAGVSIADADQDDVESELQHIKNLAKTIFSLLGKLFLVVLVVFAAIFIARVLYDSHYSIQQINVPDAFEKAGHTGPVVANRIYARLGEIIRRVSASEYARNYSTRAAETDASVELAGMGMPVKKLIEMIGGVFGINRKKFIDADIYVEGPLVVMTLRVTGQYPERFEAPINDNIGIPLKELVSKASEAILKYSNDEALQTFYGHIERNGEKAMKLAQYRRGRYKGNVFMEARMVSAWARGLSLLKRYDEAEEKLKEGIALNGKEGRLYSVWGLMLQEQGRHEDAKEKLLKASSLMGLKESKFRRSSVLTAIGVSFSKLGQSASAVEYYRKAMAMDENACSSYYQLSKEYLAQGKKELFFELAEQALVKGIRPQILSGDPDLKVVMDDPHMRRLLENYREE